MYIAVNSVMPIVYLEEPDIAGVSPFVPGPGHVTHHVTSRGAFMLIPGGVTVAAMG